MEEVGGEDEDGGAVEEGEGGRDAALEAVGGEVEQLEVREGGGEGVGDGAGEGVGLEAEDAQLGERGEEGGGEDAGE
ncbi:Os02g0830750, partial [Oryza sativa Japonica Group]